MSSRLYADQGMFANSQPPIAPLYRWMILYDVLSMRLAARSSCFFHKVTREAYPHGSILFYPDVSRSCSGKGSRCGTAC